MFGVFVIPEEHISEIKMKAQHLEIFWFQTKKVTKNYQSLMPCKWKYFMHADGLWSVWLIITVKQVGT